MSHFTRVKTRFQNLFYLEKAFAKLNIAYTKQKSNVNSISDTKSLVIPQSNDYNLEFAWNGEEYEFIADLSFWKQPYPVESFLDKVGQKYAGELISNESQKIGFEPIQYVQDQDGSNTLILERVINKNKKY